MAKADQTFRFLVIFFEHPEMLSRIPKVFPSLLKAPVRCSVPMIVSADLEKHFPMMQDRSVSLPDAHPAIVDMVGFGATAIELKDLEILPLFQVLYGTCLNIIADVVKFIGVMTQFIKHLQKIFIYLPVQVGKVRAAIMIARIREVEYLPRSDHPVEAMTVTVSHLFHPVPGPGVGFDEFL